MEDSALHTVTHARLRALQGDVAGAVAILETVLARRPHDLAARELLATLPGGAGPGPEIEEVAAPPAESASAAELAHRFQRTLGRPSPRRRRLERFLAVVTHRAR
ncbi:MAG TPA: hypothetical protein VFO11_14125 [Candidatus Polarisedimenticolaceae bacterium]|nr:hypothetical protein [Candidatus Polarisedimenticolaceae bacterium]